MCISSVIHRKTLHKLRDSPYFGIMVNESTDIFVVGHLVIFGTFLEDGAPLCVFLGLLNILGSRKDANAIYELLLTSMNKWGLDLKKCVGFGSDYASVMTRCCNRVVLQLKKHVSPFFLRTRYSLF